MKEIKNVMLSPAEASIPLVRKQLDCAIYNALLVEASPLRPPIVEASASYIAGR